MQRRAGQPPIPRSQCIPLSASDCRMAGEDEQRRLALPGGWLQEVPPALWAANQSSLPQFSVTGRMGLEAANVSGVAYVIADGPQTSGTTSRLCVLRHRCCVRPLYEVKLPLSSC